jgi:hypothetical protein
MRVSFQVGLRHASSTFVPSFFIPQCARCQALAAAAQCRGVQEQPLAPCGRCRGMSFSTRTVLLGKAPPSSESRLPAPWLAPDSPLIATLTSRMTSTAPAEKPVLSPDGRTTKCQTCSVRTRRSRFVPDRQRVGFIDRSCLRRRGGRMARRFVKNRRAGVNR